MKKYGLLFLLVLGLPLAAAPPQTPEAPPPSIRIGPLRLEQESFSKNAGHCDGVPCMISSIDYLRVVSAENEHAAAKLTAALADWALQMDKGKAAKGPHDWVQWWVDRELKIRQEMLEPADSPVWRDTTRLNVEYQSARVVSLSLLNRGFYGGAHGNDGLAYANFRPSTGDRILLTEILEPGFKAPLNAVGERRFRELKGLGSQASLKEADYWFPNGQFQLNQNFSIRAGGLVFHFNSDEIAPHGLGPTDLLLPYAEIRQLLRPDACIP
jgi:hypothetical protein